MPKLYTKSTRKLPWKLQFKNHANNKLNKKTFMIRSTLENLLEIANIF